MCKRGKKSTGSPQIHSNAYTMLDKIFSRQYIFSYFSQKSSFDISWELFPGKTGFDISCILLPKVKICICRSLFSGKNNENIVSLLSAELAQRGYLLQVCFIVWADGIPRKNH